MKRKSSRPRRLAATRSTAKASARRRTGKGHRLARKAQVRVVSRAAADVPRFAAMAGGSPNTLLELEETALRQGGVGPRDFAIVRPALNQTATLYRAMLDNSLSVEDAATLLRVDASRVRQRLAGRTLYGIKTSEGWRLPRFQFSERGGLVSGIDKVLTRLPVDLNPVAVYRWFTTPNVDLHTRDDEEQPLTPLEWLETGHSPDSAAELAVEL